MLQLGVETTNRCNLKCLHCLRDKSVAPADLPLTLFSKIVKKAKAYGMLNIAFTGGEPTLHPAFSDMVAITRKENLSFLVVTNGWNFKKIYPLFLDNKAVSPLRIVFSLDGAKRQTHDTIRGAGSFDRVIQAMVICKEKKIPFAIQMVIAAINKNEMENMGVLASALNCAKLLFVPPFPTLNFIKNNLMISPHEYGDITKKTAKLKSYLRIPIQSAAQEVHFGGARLGGDYLFNCCMLNGHFLNVDCRGNLTFCCNLSTFAETRDNREDIIGSLKKESFEILYKKFLKKLYAFHEDRVDNVQQGKAYDMEKSGFACLYCLRYFKKLNWAKKLPRNNPWYQYVAMKK